MYIFSGRVKEIANLIPNNINKDGKIINKVLLGQKISSKFEESLKNEDVKNMFINDSPGEREVISWKNSIPEIIEILLRAKLDNLHVIFEYNIPGANSRIDVVIIGSGKDNDIIALIVELKQWTSIIEDLTVNKCKVAFDYNGNRYIRYHPCLQLKTYDEFLHNHHSEVVNGNIKLYSCGYLHNFNNKDSLFLNQYKSYKVQYNDKLFVKDEESKREFIKYLKNIFKNTSEDEYVNRFSNSSYKITENAFENIKLLLNGESAVTLLKEQRPVLIDIFDSINNFIKKGKELKSNGINDNRRLVGIISGEVGVGKTILGLDILRMIIEKFYPNRENCHFTVKNATLNEIMSYYCKSNITSTLSKNLNGNVLIIDEAHRLGRENQSLQEIISNIILKNQMVFFLQDDNQRILIQEKGTVKNINDAIKNISKDINIVYTNPNGHKLSTQLRALESGNYIDMLNKFLSDDVEIDKEFVATNYYVEIKESLNEIKTILENKNKEYRCRWILPFCWEWHPDSEKAEITINKEFNLQWNPIPNSSDELQAKWFIGDKEKYIEKKNSNNYTEEGLYDDKEKYLNKAGCIYTVQGLDFDFTGNIFWSDLYWDNKLNKWNVDLNKIKDKKYLIDGIVKYYGGNSCFFVNEKYYVFYNKNKYEIDAFLKEVNADMNEVIGIVKNIYRVLLSRAKKGIYIWFEHEETKKRFESIFKEKIEQ